MILVAPALGGPWIARPLIRPPSGPDPSPPADPSREAFDADCRARLAAELEEAEDGR